MKDNELQRENTTKGSKDHLFVKKESYFRSGEHIQK